MTIQFLERVRRERIVETRKYRYLLHSDFVYDKIIRLPLSLLGTTCEMSDWQTVAIIDKDGIHKKEGVR